MGHCVPNTISFVTEKEHYFTLTERKKTNLSELTQVFCDLLSLLFKNP